MPILLDFESVSRADLKRVGGRNYWADPSTRALCAVLYDTDTGDVGRWLPGDPCPVDPGDLLGAHNATGFDRFGWARTWGIPADVSYVDTSELARKSGLPGALDALGTRWLGLPKDKDASRFTTALSSVRKPRDVDAAAWRELGAEAKRRRGTLPEITPDVMARVLPYCALDVRIIAAGWEVLRPWIDVDAATSWAERRVNDRGVGFDVQLARRLLACDAEIAGRAVEAAASALGVTFERARALASSPAQFEEYCGIADAQKVTVENLLAQEGFEDPGIVALAKARQALASIARGKLTAGLDRVSPDGRLRDSHRYYGAHTGRWSGRGMQLQNIPRPSKRFEEWGDAEICRAVDEVLAGRLPDADEIDVLLRATLVAAPGHALAVCDFSGVEARALAWCAGDRGALEVFGSTRDPYKVAASVIFGRPYDTMGKVERQVGKVAELACGYGMGARKFHDNNASALDSAGVSAEDVVAGWRKLHAPIVSFWRDVERAFIGACNGRRAEVSCFAFVPADDGSAVAAILPSGRPIVYEGASTVPGKYGPSPVFHGIKGREHTYGGKLTENLIQALCRDLLADALVRVERDGLAPVLHVHDEIVCEVLRGDEGLAALKAAMLTLPEWARGFPVGAAGHHGFRYRK